MSEHRRYYKVGPDLDDRNGILDKVIDEKGEEFPDMWRGPAPTKATARWSDSRTKHGHCLRSWSTGHLIISKECFQKVSELVLHPGTVIVPTTVIHKGRPQVECMTYYFPDKLYDIVNLRKSKAEWYDDGWPMRFIGEPVVDTREIHSLDVVLTCSLGYVVSQTFKDIVEENRFKGFLFEPLIYQSREEGDPIGLDPARVKKRRRKT